MGSAAGERTVRIVVGDGTNMFPVPLLDRT
jgi:hypothetical protein